MEEQNTTTTLDLFKMSDEELYDDNDNLEEKENRPTNKTNKKLKICLILALCLSFVCVGICVYETINFTKLNNEIETLKNENDKLSSTIKTLNETIVLKDSEIEKLNKEVKPVEVKPTEENKNNQKEEITNVSTSEGKDGSIYKVTSSTGINIREKADIESDIVASLAYGDTFEQAGNVITDSDGNKWVEFKWDNGFGMIKDKDGNKFASLN